MPARCKRADQTKPGVVDPGPHAVGGEAVVGLVGEGGAVVGGALGRTRDVDITGRGQVDSEGSVSLLRAVITQILRINRCGCVMWEKI